MVLRAFKQVFEEISEEKIIENGSKPKEGLRVDPLIYHGRRDG